MCSIVIWKKRPFACFRRYLVTLPYVTGPIERVTTFKLLGLHLDAGLSWTTHINTIVSKASKRLYFLKQLRRAGVPPQQLLHFYTAVIRPVLEYASPVWHYSITRAQSKHLESIQILAVHSHRLQFYPWHVISQRFICRQLKFNTRQKR